MPKVIIKDKDWNEHTIEVEKGTNLLAVIQDSGVDINSSCGGGGWCSTCVVRVEQGGIGDTDNEALSAMDVEDLQTMEENGLDTTNQVLSCQCFIKNDCRIVLPDC